MLDLETITNTLAGIEASALGHTLHFSVIPAHNGWLLQVQAYLPDTTRPEFSCHQAGGKLYLSAHATHHELVLKAWQAVQSFVLHELRESFFYKGAALFQPHVDVDALAAFQTACGPVYRPCPSDLAPFVDFA